MKSIIAILCLLLLSTSVKRNDTYKDIVKHFYELLYKESVSIKEFSLVYSNASLNYDTDLYLKDSYGITNYNYHLTESRNKSIDIENTPSYVFKKIKQEFNSLTFGLTFDELVKIIDSAELSTQGLKFSRIIELIFPGGKRIYMELNNDTPTLVLWIWLNNAVLIDDVINNNATNPQRLKLVGTINDRDGFVNIRKNPDINSEIIETFKEGDILYYIPDNSVNWWQVYSGESSSSIIGYLHKSRIKKYNDMPDDLMKKVSIERSSYH